MHRTTQRILIAALLALSCAAGTEPVKVTIDAARTAAPVTRLVFGGFMEPATTRVWAEMLYDRKFFNEINSKPQPEPRGFGFGRRGPMPRWKPVGADEFVRMDRQRVYVGEWSPAVKLDPREPHGIVQSGLSLRANRAYTGRVVLAGVPGARVSVSLSWGPQPADRQSITVGPLTGAYVKYPLKFTARADTTEGALEISAVGSGTLHIGAASLMPADNISGFKAGMVRLLKEQGIEIARWPGGNFVSAYDWRDGLGDADLRPPRRELAWGGLESNDMGIDDFLTFCKLLGAEPYIAVNTGLGDAHSAAEEVEYVNGPATSRLGRLRAANGHPAPYHVKIWGIGNEMYGPWQWGHMAPNQYVEKHNLVVKQMRKVDPSIKVIASSATPEETSWCYIENRQFGTFQGREKLNEKPPFPFFSKHDWTGAFLEHSADYIDYLGEHFYGYPSLAIDAEKELFVDANDALPDKVRRLSNKVQFKFEAWETYVQKMPYLKDKDIRFAFDEWSPRSRAVNPSGPPPAPHPMLNPMTNALVYHEFFRHSDKVGLAVATGGMGTLALDPYGEAIGLRMEGQVVKLLHDRFAGALPVAVSGDSPQRPIRGVVGIDTSARPSGSPTHPLDVFAAVSADRKRFAISVVNPSETAQECELNLTGVQLGAGRLWQLTAPAGAPQAPAARPGMFAGPPVTPAESALPQAPRTLTLPPASISVYEFEVKP